MRQWRRDRRALQRSRRAPKEGVVTLYAAATADHSRYSSVTLTMVGLPISVGFAQTPPSSLSVNGTAPLKAVLTNDYVAGGARWTVTCGSTRAAPSAQPRPQVELQQPIQLPRQSQRAAT